MRAVMPPDIVKPFGKGMQRSNKYLHRYHQPKKAREQSASPFTMKTAKKGRLSRGNLRKVSTPQGLSKKMGRPRSQLLNN